MIEIKYNQRFPSFLVCLPWPHKCASRMFFIDVGRYGAALATPSDRRC